MSEPADGRRLGQFMLLEQIGAGGLGEVFRARDTRHGRTVALKILPHDFIHLDELRETARLASVLSHPAVAMLFESGEADGRTFLAYEFVTGETLRKAIAGGPMHPRRAVPIAIQVADALAEAHAASIVHRDIKPDNIIVTPKGAAKVLDFGLAPWTRGGAARESVTGGARIEPALVETTIAYMSPEQALEQPTDGRTDIYSLGVVLYEMLTGRNPFAAADAEATLVNILKVEPHAPSRANTQVPAALDAAVLRMLARDVQQRVGSAAAAAAELRAAYAERTEYVFEPEFEPAALARPQGRSGRRTFLVAALAVLAAAAIAYPQRGAFRRVVRRWFGPMPSPRLAIAPLEEPGASQSYYADGVSDDLAAHLGQTPGITVVGRSSIRSFRGRSPSEVATETGAAVVLAGTLIRADGELNVDVRLVDGSDGVELWHQRFTNAPATIVAAQAVIAEEVAKALALSPQPVEMRVRSLARTIDPDAYETYTRGRDALARGNHDAAASLFEDAIRQDDGFVEAYAGIAQAVYGRAAASGGTLDRRSLEALELLVGRAAAVEPDLAWIEIAASLAAPGFRESLRHLARAVTLDPSLAAGYRQIVDLIAPVDPTRAAALGARAGSLDPRARPAKPVATPAVLEVRSRVAGERESLKAIVDEELAGVR